MKEKHEPIDFRNHRYSSIDMARETGMSSEGLRFYERKGILQVDKDEKNSYRTYPIMKVPMMRSAKILGTYGISLDSVAEIIQDHDHHLDHLDRTLEQAEARLNHDIEWKRRCLAALREQREIISHGIGTVYFAELDKMAYLEYYGAEKLRANKKLRGQVDQWLQGMPIVMPAPCCPRELVGQDCYCPAGFMVRQADMDFLGLREEENVRVLPARLCVCTTVAQREEIGIMAKEAIEPLLIFIQQTGLCVADDALFRCISFESNENSSGKIYYHVMLPVEVGKTPK